MRSVPAHAVGRPAASNSTTPRAGSRSRTSASTFWNAGSPVHPISEAARSARRRTSPNASPRSLWSCDDARVTSRSRTCGQSSRSRPSPRVKPPAASASATASAAPATRTAQPLVPRPSRHAAMAATTPSTARPAARIQPGERIHSAPSAADAATAASHTARGRLT